MWRERPSSIGAYLQPPAASDRPARRIGCGCLPVVILLFVGSFLVRAVESVTDTEIDGGLVAVAVIVGILVLAIVGSRRRTRRDQERDAISDGAPTSTRPPEQPLPSAPPPTTTPPRAPRPATPPSGGQTPIPRPRPSSPGPRASDASLEPEAESLRQRLADAVADIAAEVDSSATSDPVRRPTSEEMIARAKQRIRDRGDQGD